MKTIILLLISLLALNSCGGLSEKEDANIGEFTHRMNMAKERLLGTKHNPVFTPEFILADVNLNPIDPRRFDNYSGDISGRYIEVLSTACKDGKCDYLHDIVRQALKYQHPDGRFGDPALVFKEELIGRDHMPLLWGNGRLLAGLVEYYKLTRNEQVLQAARRLADFFLSAYQEVTPEVSKRLDGRGADGIICFTQYTEPLAMLSMLTGDSKYAQAAAKVYPTLPERTTLHSHGYLTTMRGALQLYEFDKNRQHFDYVVKAYADLVASDDYTIFGSVKEYFSNARGGRDEGCSTADFIQLSLHLYKLTGNIDYLERAEFAIFNSLYYNQYFTGDFGSHTLNRNASRPDIMSACWWCCTMAGLRVMQVIRNDYFAEVNNGSIKLNLYLDTDYANEQVSFSVLKGKMQDDCHTYNIDFKKIEQPITSFAMRNPSWADNVDMYLNGKKVEYKSANGYLMLENRLKAGDALQLRLKYRTRIIDMNNNFVKPADVTRPINGTLCYGPYILGVDTHADIVFSSEPSNNVVFVETIANSAGIKAMDGIKARSFVGDAYLTANYQHGGFPSYYQTVFRPISELTYLRHPYSMITTTFASGTTDRFSHINKSALVPWKE